MAPNGIRFHLFASTTLSIFNLHLTSHNTLRTIHRLFSLLVLPRRPLHLEPSLPHCRFRFTALVNSSDPPPSLFVDKPLPAALLDLGSPQWSICVGKVTPCVTDPPQLPTFARFFPLYSACIFTPALIIKPL